jgi:hypothetical protein
MNVRRTAAVAVLPSVLLGGLIVGAAPAFARGGGGGGNDVRASGPCATGTWNLKVKPDDGRIEVEAEIDTNRVGQVWNWRLSDNGAQFASGSSTTAAPSGSFSVERRTANRPGADTVRLTATRGTVTCHGVVTLP